MEPNDLGGQAVKVYGDAGYVYNAHLSAYGKLGAGPDRRRDRLRGFDRERDRAARPLRVAPGQRGGDRSLRDPDDRLLDRHQLRGNAEGRREAPLFDVREEHGYSSSSSICVMTGASATTVASSSTRIVRTPWLARPTRRI